MGYRGEERINNDGLGSCPMSKQKITGRTIRFRAMLLWLEARQ